MFEAAAWYLQHFRLGNAGAHPQGRCTQRECGATPSCSPQKVTVGAMRLSSSGNDACAPPANHRLGGTPLVWCTWTRSGAERSVVKRVTPERALGLVNGPYPDTRRLLAHHGRRQKCAPADSPAPFHTMPRRDGMANKEKKARKKVSSPPWMPRLGR